MIKQRGFLVNLERCVGCKACELACRNEHWRDRSYYRQVIDIAGDKLFSGFLSLGCNHCQNPECLRVCKQKCFYKRRDGIVLHNPQNCDGCRSCAGACPFKAPKFNPRTKKISKCNFCLDYLEQGKQPACVSACVVGALQMVDIFQSPPGASKTITHYSLAQFTQPSIRFILPTAPRCSWRIS